MGLLQQNSERVSFETRGANGQNVAVVGGSAAGFFTAALLARRGVPVRVFERTETLDHSARTLIVTHRMRHLLGAAAESCIVNEIRRFEIFTDGRVAHVALQEPDRKSVV